MNSRKIRLSAVSIFAAAAILLTACGGTKNPAKDNGSDSKNEKPNPVSEFEYTIDSATDTVTECDRNAFHGCESLPEVEYRGTVYKNSDGGGVWDMYDLVTAIRAQNQDKE